MAMLGINLVGATMVAYAVKGLYEQNPKRKFKRIVKASFFTHEMTFEPDKDHMDKIKIEKVEAREYGFHFIITLPSGLTVEKFRKYLPALEQDTYSKVKFRHIKGRKCSLDFGTIDLEESYNYSQKLPKKELTVPFYSHFGWKTIDFWKESCWHCLMAGATGMGKSFLLRYVITHLFISREGEIQFFISSNKITDFYMYRKIPQISLAKTIDQTVLMLQRLIQEAERREELVCIHDVIDVRELRKKTGMKLPPIFLVIDEYARFADDEPLQDMIMKIVETYRYLDIHLIVCTQRPDSTTVIPSRIRANLLGNICLPVRDEANSKMVIGSDEADMKKLGQINGRAIIQDGFTTMVQVPFIKDEQIINLLEPYYRSVDNEESKGYENLEIPETIPSVEQAPTGEIVFSNQQKPTSSRKPGNEKAKTRRKRNRHPKTEGSVLPVYAEPNYDSPQLNKD
jgi:hypothetical protein